MRTIFNIMAFVAAIVLTAAVTMAFAGEPMRACTQADGTVLYTNKNVKGCTTIRLPELSTAPTRTYPTPQQPVAIAPTITPAPLPPEPGTGVQERICMMYSDWIALNQRTSGGAHYRDFSDNGLEGNARRLILANLFSGFVPVGCS